MSLLFECGDAAPDWPFFRHVILDCDSTLCSIEGIDCLAAHPDTNKKVVALTEAAMNGELPLVEAYQHRLELIAPTHQAVRSLAKQYQQHLVPRSREVVAALRDQGCELYIVSGGLLEPVMELGVSLDIPANNIRAVEIEYDQLAGEWWRGVTGSTTTFAHQRYLTYRYSELAESNGKANIIHSLLKGKTGGSLLLGDGVSDLLAMNAVDLFVGFGGVKRRVKVEREAPVFIQSPSLLSVLALALGSKAFNQIDEQLKQEVINELDEWPLRFNRKLLEHHFKMSF